MLSSDSSESESESDPTADRWFSDWARRSSGDKSCIDSILDLV